MKRLKRAKNSLRDFWIDHLWIDLAVAGVVVAVHAVLLAPFPVLDILGNAAPSDRRAAYSATAIVVSLLGSFSSVAISQLSAAKGARADALRSSAAEDLASNWRSVFRVGMAAALVAVLCLLLDPSDRVDSVVPVCARWLFEFCFVLATVKFFRLSGLFFEVITLANKSADDEGDEQLEPELFAVENLPAAG